MNSIAKYLLPSLLLVIIACNREIKPDGGPCSYEEFVITALIKEVSFDEEDGMTVTFELQEEIPQLPRGTWEHHTTRSDTLFRDELLLDPGSLYELSGEAITRGSCNPVHMQEVRLSDVTL